MEVVEASQIVLREKSLPNLPAAQTQITATTAASADPQAWSAVGLITQGMQLAAQTVSSYFTTKTALSTFPSAIPPNSNTIAIYNDGKLVVPQGTNQSATGQNIVIYNGARGELFLAPPPPSTKISCPRCKMEFNNAADAQEHQMQFVEHCRVHRVCFQFWTEHNIQIAHRRCGVIGCAKAMTDFGNAERYAKHFRNKHSCARK
ncbi:hypothetical protein NA57DRAFT_51243 [Rhizodiscina lignyota]|uniref:Uncharacterized protein n=1 Tax=Rhizodiscina lignyota TaxID=1504668 RepID=A0A9P4IUA8_9PEZI|nr:hypothetical protein NA57DRAFT_51243 [Rhizodiscina lignyota]